MCKEGNGAGYEENIWLFLLVAGRDCNIVSPKSSSSLRARTHTHMSGANVPAI